MIFAVLAGLVTLAEGHSPIFGVFNAMLAGTGVGLFEQFYVQSRRGQVDAQQPSPSFDLDLYHRRCHVVFTCDKLLARAAALSVSGAGALWQAAVHSSGRPGLFGGRHRRDARGAFHRHRDLVPSDDRHLSPPGGRAEGSGLYRHQQFDRRSPSGSARSKIKSLVGKFLFDISKPITDYGGEIYLYKGDGLIAIWDWREAVRDDKILRAIDAVFAAVRPGTGPLYGAVRCRPDAFASGCMAATSSSANKATPSARSASMAARSTSPRAWRKRQRRMASPARYREMSRRRCRARRPAASDRLRKIKGISAEIPIFEYREEPALERGSDRPAVGDPARGRTAAPRFDRLKAPFERSN